MRNKLTYLKDKSLQNPNCRIVDIKTGKVLKEYGATINQT